jgi:crossover junction endodeoxyribonuclease RuvC
MLQKNYRFKTYIGIDPGKSGGICSIEDNRLRANKCPDSVQGMAELFKDILQDTSPKDVFLYIEKVWAMPHDGKSSIFTFGQNYGQWEGVIASFNIIPIYVTPSTWMRHHEVQKGLKKQERKNILKQMAQEFINSNNYMSYQWKGVATLATADAIMIAKYAIAKTD